MPAYDLWFGEPPALTPHPDLAPGAQPDSAPTRAGRTGVAGPAIDPATWPRGPVTGLPMMHALTMWLPREYRRRGPEFPGIAFFAGEGQFADPDSGAVADPDADDPFLRDLATARPHPTLRLMTDVIDGRWALLWLTAEELTGTPTPPPVDARRPGEHGPDDEGANAWDHRVPEATIWQTVRPDPNAGIAPSGDGAGGYRSPLDLESRRYTDWADPLAGRSHLGGTTFCVQAVPEGLTPYYLELEQFGDLNFGGDGNCQIDLASDVFDWACG